MCLGVIAAFLGFIGFLVIRSRYKKGSQGSPHGRGGGDEEEGLMKSTIDTTINEPGKCTRPCTGKDPGARYMVEEGVMKRRESSSRSFDNT